MLRWCTYDGRQCEDEEFSDILDPDVGKCFSFNFDARCQAKRSGQINGIHLKFFHRNLKRLYFLGLSMLLFVNQSENLLTSQKAGLLATIHNANDTVIPNAMGFSVPVGFSVTFSVRRVSILRLSAPYGDCIDTPNANEYFYKSAYSVEVYWLQN